MDGAGEAFVYDTSVTTPLNHDDIVLEFDTTGPAILTRRWLHSAAVDEPVGFEDYASTSGVGIGAERVMFADRQGSVLWVVEPSTAAVLAGYEYDGYGQITQATGTLRQRYGYTGREYDAESGLYHYRARSYDPNSGVFVQSDPIEFLSGHLNVFTLVSNDPFNLFDPSGLTATSEMSVLDYAMVAGALSAAYTLAMDTSGLFGAISHALNRETDKIHSAPGTAPPVGASAGDPPPPGNCTKKEHKRLEKERIKRTNWRGHVTQRTRCLR